MCGGDAWGLLGWSPSGTRGHGTWGQSPEEMVGPRVVCSCWAPPVATPTHRATGVWSAGADSAPLQELHVCPRSSQERLVLKFLNGKSKQVENNQEAAVNNN